MSNTQKLLAILVICSTAALSLGAVTANALSTYQVVQGGTGATTLSSSQLLYGAGTSPVQTVATTSVAAGTGVSLSANPGALVGGSNLTITNTGVISNSCPGGFLTCSGTNPSSFTLGTLGITNGGTATTTFYSGGVVFSDSSKLTQAPGSAFGRFVWDNTNFRLGIGTSSPQRAFHVANGGANSQILLEDSNAAANQHYGSIGFSQGRFTINTMTDAYASTTRFAIDSAGKVGIGTSTPFNQLSVTGGAIQVDEYAPATSTSMTLDPRNGNQQLIRHGFSATTIGFTGFSVGQKLVAVVCNPGGTGGAITWTGVNWSGGTVPTQTTTANKCDVWSFLGTNGTTSPQILGTQSANF